MQTTEQDGLRALIESVRTERGWSRRQLAQQCRIAPSTIHSMFDPGRRHFVVTFQTLERLSAGLNVPISTLLLAQKQTDADGELQRLLDIWARLDPPTRTRLLMLAEDLQANTR